MFLVEAARDQADAESDGVAAEIAANARRFRFSPTTKRATRENALWERNAIFIPRELPE